MNARRSIHRLQGAAFVVLALLASTCAHQLGFHVLAWNITGVSILALWVAAGICMGWLGRPSLRGSSWAVLGMAALMVGLRAVPAITETMAFQWEGTAVAQMLWGSAFVCVGCGLARGLHVPRILAAD